MVDGKCPDCGVDFAVVGAEHLPTCIQVTYWENLSPEERDAIALEAAEAAKLDGDGMTLAEAKAFYRGLAEGMRRAKSA